MSARYSRARVASTYDVKRLERRLASASAQRRFSTVECELRDCVVELAVVCNVIELSPRERVVRGSIAHERARARLAALLDRLDVLELAEAA
jgi:hypothetical protein